MGDMREVFDLHRQVDKERKLTGAVRNRQHQISHHLMSLNPVSR